MALHMFTVTKKAPSTATILTDNLLSLLTLDFFSQYIYSPFLPKYSTPDTLRNLGSLTAYLLLLPLAYILLKLTICIFCTKVTYKRQPILARVTFYLRRNISAKTVFSYLSGY